MRNVGDEIRESGEWRGVERAQTRAERDKTRRVRVRGASLLRGSSISRDLFMGGERGARPSRSAGLTAVVKLCSYLTRVRLVSANALYC